MRAEDRDTAGFVLKSLHPLKNRLAVVQRAGGYVHRDVRVLHQLAFIPHPLL